MVQRSGSGGARGRKGSGRVGLLLRVLQWRLLLFHRLL